ncbi:MAG: hypothetical protein ACI945_000104 [Pseudohongiellaceae bacterium]
MPFFQKIKLFSLYSRNYILRFYPVLLLAVFVLISFGLQRMFVPTPGLGIDAPKSVFSSGRAFSDLQYLLKENVPHPSGSESNKIIRDRIVSRMKSRGFEVEIQPVFNCVESEDLCSSAENVVAFKKGVNSQSSIMLMAHYDSVPASSAAGDDGFGVATLLEIANVMQHELPYDNDLIFLFTDAEELGLNGAVGFSEEHPLMSNVAIILNIESRGTSGQSIMFESGQRNSELLDVYSSVIDRPVANSLLEAIYRKMPNDTDYSVFKRRDIAGFNFASVGSALRYHSVLDDLDHLDLDTLQQHGSNVLSMLRAYSDMDLENISERVGEATYFDLFSTVMVKWDSSLNIPLSLSVLLLIVGLVWQKNRRQPIELRLYLWAFLNLAAVSITILSVVTVLTYPLAIWVDHYPLDYINPWPGKIAIWASILLSVIVVSRFTFTRVSFNHQLLIGWLVIALMALVLGLELSGASYVLLVPLGLFLLGILADFCRVNFNIQKLEFVIGPHLGFVATVYMGIYHFHVLDMALGFDRAALKSIPFLFMSIALLPLLHNYYRKEVKYYSLHVLTLGMTLLFSLLIGMNQPGYTKDKPAPLNIVYVEDWDTKEAFWMLDSDGNGYSRFSASMGFSLMEKKLAQYGGTKHELPIRKSTYRNLAPPEFDVYYDKTVAGVRIIKFSLQSTRGGYQMHLFSDMALPIKSFKVNGKALYSKFEVQGLEKNFKVTLGASQQAPFQIEIRLKGSQPFSLDVVEVADLVETDEYRSVASLRPIIANEVNLGDRSVVYKKIIF